MNKKKFLEEYSELEFLNLCRLVAGQDTAELTGERIEAINVVRANPCYIVRRLLEIFEHGARERESTANNQFNEIWQAAKDQGLIPGGNEFTVSVPAEER